MFSRWVATLPNYPIVAARREPPDSDLHIQHQDFDLISALYVYIT